MTGKDAQTAPPQGRLEALKRAARFLIPWIITAGIFFFIFSRVEWQATLEAMSGLSLPLWTAIILADFTAYYFSEVVANYLTFKWHLDPVPFSRVMIARGGTFILNLVNFLLGMGGMGYWLNRARKTDAKEAVGAMVYLTFIDGYNVFILSALGLLLTMVLYQAGLVVEPSIEPVDFLRFNPDGNALRLVFIGFFALTVQVVIWVAKPDWKLFRFLFRGPFVILGRTKATQIIMLLIVKHLLFLCDLAASWAGLRLFGVDASPLAILAFLPIIHLIGNVPVTVMRLGTTQLAWLYFFKEASLLPGTASGGPEIAERVLAFSILWSFSMLLMRSFTGLACLPATLRDLRGDTKNAE